MLCEDFAYPKLLNFFEEISAIPRPPYREEKIASYIEAFGRSHDLETYRDSLGNVLINIPATVGRENAPALLLQGHVDMVCEKNEGVEHDFLSDPLKLYVTDGILRAQGTTLGADNGVAVAVMLALIDGADIPHGPLQCLFTVSEEVGLDGAKAFDYSRIYARKMINMDSADERLIISGCAGGLRSSVTLPIERAVRDGKLLKIAVKGLFGGHSGEDINKGRANANKLMGRILLALKAEAPELLLVSMNGGTKENAIPREATAVISVNDTEKIRTLCDGLYGNIVGELVTDDKEFSITVDECESELDPMTESWSDKCLFFLSALSNGVLEMDNKVEGIVEYSRNLGIVTTDRNSIELVINTRSAREARLDHAERELDAYGQLLGGKSEHFNRYPGWVYSEISTLRDTYAESYFELFGEKTEVEIIHAGLECGIIKQALPDMDVISCGPYVRDLHSPCESLDLRSFERFFAVILKTLEKLK